MSAASLLDPTMLCTSCNTGRTRPERRTKAIDGGGRLVVVRDVPVDVCDACGDAYIEAPVAKRMDALVIRLLAAGGDVTFTRYDLS